MLINGGLISYSAERTEAFKRAVQTKPDDKSTTKRVKEIIPDGPPDNVAEMIEASPTVTAKIELGDDGGYHTLTCFPDTVVAARKSHRSRGIGIALLLARSVVLLHDECAIR